MGEVKRYELQGDGALLWRDDGKYVLQSDYATLEADFDKLFEAGLKQQGEYRSLEAERDALRAEVKQAYEDGRISACNAGKPGCPRVKELEAEVAKLTAALNGKENGDG